jgi:hypothetical protein
MPRVYFDRTQNLLIPGIGTSGTTKSITLKRGDAFPLEIVILDGDVAATLTLPPLIRFGVKDAIDGTLLVYAEDFAEGSESHIFTGPVNTNTSELTTWLTGEVKKTGVAEITFSFDSGATWVSTTQELSAICLNDVLKLDEEGLEDLPDPDSYVAARAVLHDRAQSLTSSAQDQALTNLGLQPAQGGLSIRFDLNGGPWLWLWNLETERFEPVCLDGEAPNQRVAFLNPEEAPFA